VVQYILSHDTLLIAMHNEARPLQRNITVLYIIKGHCMSTARVLSIPLNIFCCSAPFCTSDSAVH